MFRPLQQLLDMVLPPRCPGCRTIVTGDGRFCVACWQELRFITAPMCSRCGDPFEVDMGPTAECGPCLAAPPRYDRARAALVYGGPARTVLLGLKHADRDYLARMMAGHMARASAGLIAPDSLVVPVPLHRWRLWRRGFNQSALLARALAAQGGGELAVDALTRVRPTPPSVGMGRAARARNVRGAFRVKDRAQVAGRAIVLVDDVLTTGATADACARVLRRAGARDVTVLTFARVVRDSDPIFPHDGTGALVRGAAQSPPGDENGQG